MVFVYLPFLLIALSGVILMLAWSSFFCTLEVKHSKGILLSALLASLFLALLWFLLEMLVWAG